jgi:hypothetical protein
MNSIILKTLIAALALNAAVLTGLSIAGETDWYEESFIHSHVSLSLPPDDIDFIAKQIKDTGVEAVQFHTHNLSLWKVIDDRKLYESLEFKKVATINRSGTWYAEYDKDTDKYTMRINSDGTFAGRWTRQHLCFNAPVFRQEIIPYYYHELPKKLDPAQVWIDECIITVNICYCEHCLAKYKKIYNAEPPAELTDDNWDQWVQWVDFHRDSFDDWMIDVRDSIQKAVPDCLVTFNHAYFVEQPEAPPEFIKNLSGDIHNDHLELSIFARYGGTSGLPFDLMPGLGSDIWAGVKPKTQETIYTDVALITAHGGRWNIGEYPTTFTKLRKEEEYQGPGYRRADIYMELANNGARFARDRKDFCMNTDSVPYAAMLHSARTHYSHSIINTNFVNEKEDFGKTSDGTISRNTLGRINSRIYWPNNKPIYDNLIGAYESLIETHTHFDIIREDQLQKNLGNYKMLVLSEQAWLEDETVAKIKDYLANGGTVLAAGSTVKAGLADVLGVKNVNNEPAQNLQVDINGEKVVLESAYIVKPAGARVVSNYDDTDIPFVTINKYKNGRCFYISGDIFKEYFDRSGYSHRPSGNNSVLRQFIASIYQELLPDGGISLQASPWYELTVRENSSGETTFVHVINRRMDWKQTAGNDMPIKIALPLTAKPGSVKMQPDNVDYDFDYKGSMLSITVDPADVDIHKIIEIKK